MKKLILVLVAVAALAVPAAASAHHGHGHAFLGIRISGHGNGRAAFGVKFAAVQHGTQLGLFAHAAKQGNDGDDDDDTATQSTAVFEKLVGTGASFGSDSATASGTISGRPLEGGTFSTTLTTDWSQQTANAKGGNCAPATATLSLVDATSSANTLGTTVTGKTCSVGTNDRNIAYVFFGQATVAGATGTLSSVSGTGRVLLVQSTTGVVKGFEFAGFKGGEQHSFVRLAVSDEHHCGGH